VERRSFATTCPVLHEKHNLAMEFLEAFYAKMYLLLEVVATALTNILGLTTVLVLLTT
jgi:hypothetical protein